MPTTSTQSQTRKAPARKPAASRSTSTRTTAKKTDALSLLKEDHKRVQKMFKDYEKLAEKGSDVQKETLAMEICRELTMHAQLEEELFYPAAREAIDDEDLLDEATVEHQCAKDLIAQIQSMPAADPLYDAKVKVLGEYVNHHIEEEQSELFPKVKKAKLDIEGIGKKITARKRALAKDMQQEMH